MSENKNRENDMEITSVKGILDETLKSIDKAFDGVKREPEGSMQMDNKSANGDISSVGAGHTEAAADIKEVNPQSYKSEEVNSVKNVEQKSFGDVKITNDATINETESNLTDKAINNIKEEIPDVRIVSSVKQKTVSKSKKKSKKEEELKFNGHKMAFRIFNTVFVTLVFLSIAVALLVLKRPSGFMSSENRNYAEFPEFSLRSYFSGEYTADINTYFTDTTPNREQLKAFANRFTDLFGFKLDNTVIQGANKTAIERETFDESKEITSATAVTFPTKSNEENPSTTVTVAGTTQVTGSAEN